ncbi:unnamed protein product, partial [Ectocarpus fasciculatus]
IASFLSTAAALLALLVLLCSTAVMAATQVAGTEHLPPAYDAAAPAGEGMLPGSPLGIGQKVRVDIFLGLGCEKSAMAWPILKGAASDHRNRVDFVFHILPMSDNPIVFSAAKAAHVLRAYADETLGGVEGFVDLVFGEGAILYDQQSMDLTVDEARDIIGDWPLSFSNIPADVFHSAMQDRLFDPKIGGFNTESFATAVSKTLTAVLNGKFIMHLRGDRDLRDFEVFLEHFQIEDSRRGIFCSDGIYRPAVIGLDDTSGNAWQMWSEMDINMRDAHGEMLEWQREQQEVVQEQEEAGEGGGKVREGPRPSTSSRFPSSWLSSSAEFFGSSWSTSSQEHTRPVVTKDQAGGPGAGDGGRDVEAPATASSMSKGHEDAPPSTPLSSWSSASESWSLHETSLFAELDERVALSEEAAAAAASAWLAAGGGSRLAGEGEEGEGGEEE